MSKVDEDFDGFACLWDTDVGECVPGKVQVSGDIFTDDGLGVVASHIVPFDSVTVKVVQHSHASLVRSGFTAVGLRSTSTEK